MSHSKKFLFSDQEILASELCKAIAHPARLRIVKQLKAGWVLTAAQLGKDIPLAKSTIQSHLLILQRTHLIEIEKDQGCDAGYRLVDGAYARLVEAVRSEFFD